MLIEARSAAAHFMTHRSGHLIQAVWDATRQVKDLHRATLGMTGFDVGPSVALRGEITK